MAQVYPAMVFCNITRNRFRIKRPLRLEPDKP